MTMVIKMIIKATTIASRIDCTDFWFSSFAPPVDQEYPEGKFNVFAKVSKSLFLSVIEYGFSTAALTESVRFPFSRVITVGFDSILNVPKALKGTAPV